MPSIDARLFLERLRSGERPLLVDVLFEGQYARRHLPGALSACVYNVTFLDQMSGLAPDRASPLVVYGAGEPDRSAHVAEEKLRNAGWKSVWRLEGGLAAWEAAGGPLEGEDTEAAVDLERLFRPEQRRYELLTGESVIGWEGRNRVGSHQGLLAFASGDLDFSGAEVAGGFRLDMRSIEDKDLADEELRRILVAHLLSEDFFDARNHPFAQLRIDRVEPTDAEPGRPSHRLSGMLEMRGMSQSFHCEATLANLEEGRIVLETHFDLDRTRWGVNYGSGTFFRFLGYHLVYDFVSVRVRAVLA
ncbi:MAG: YceI family protein [Desulfovibrio sp.]